MAPMWILEETNLAPTLVEPHQSNSHGTHEDDSDTHDYPDAHGPHTRPHPRSLPQQCCHCLGGYGGTHRDDRGGVYGEKTHAEE